ncbi:MAG: hypothetical protein NXI14_03910, partial [bacterium]|nr:hypothetical protein [bacterium]
VSVYLTGCAHGSVEAVTATGESLEPRQLRAGQPVPMDELRGLEGQRVVVSGNALSILKGTLGVDSGWIVFVVDEHWSYPKEWLDFEVVVEGRLQMRMFTSRKVDENGRRRVYELPYLLEGRVLSPVAPEISM